MAGGPPESRRDHTMVLDPDGPALFVFSGYLSSTVSSNALWKLDLSQTPAEWSPVGAGGDIPAPRAGHSAFYDNFVGSGRLFIFG